ncbi:MAG: hypothetical protein KUG76_05745 [Gammaproteobacteria bacterium]|nr:hypothetical protein [Gammaproteobacteria bacterium]
MTHSPIAKLQQPEPIETTPIDLLQNGAKEFIRNAIKTELAELLPKFSELQMDCKKVIVKSNIYLKDNCMLALAM